MSAVISSSPIASGLRSSILPPPAKTPGIRGIFFGTLVSSFFTILGIAVILTLLPRVLDWAVFDAVWRVDNGMACREAGACWAFIAAKSRLILFGIYPLEEQWRPQIVITIFLVMALASLPPRLWGRRLVVAWAITFLVVIVLMGGGLFGLSAVPTSAWGGLPVTLLLASLSLVLAFPMSIALAVGRRSNLPIARYLSIGLIEIIRGTPLLSLLFVASILMPLFLPDGWSPDKLMRALVALTIFSAAYLAEVVRGGLQDVSDGQSEAARALGISWFTTMRKIVIPQALRKVIPPLTNTLIVMIKNTSLVFVVGLFDLLSSTRAALADPNWPSPFAEAYLFIGFIYFALCFSTSLYSAWLEKYLGTPFSR
ncbi:polar amino acid ABC transporter, inner membrane subunit [Rhizobium sp. CF080]|uniref:amino acid ABC transporter permease n=1 Tax=Rhizobium sp. (strain CF080) TaxID=1144310 RepID=UPI000271785A|nr:amino acid ABC transporter permease [Rhizobium sp. CF080]EUB99658.1 polar amino acid ABC transporter, inner membrane subunit [Rhizobium sp. CF080]